jgi:hypothetical protein
VIRVPKGRVKSRRMGRRRWVVMMKRRREELLLRLLLLLLLVMMKKDVDWIPSTANTATVVGGCNTAALAAADESGLGALATRYGVVGWVVGWEKLLLGGCCCSGGGGGGWGRSS